ncbi:MAG: hypothetical protein ACREJQ_02200, partial [bacterium]
VVEGLYAMQTQTKSGGQPYWADFFTELQAITPPGVRLESLSVSRKEAEWAGVLKGSVRNISYEKAVRLINVLDRRVHLSPYFMNPTTMKDKPAFAVKENAIVTLGFTINFQVGRISPAEAEASVTETASAPTQGG